MALGMEKGPPLGASVALRLCYKQKWADYLAAYIACNGDPACQAQAYQDYCDALENECDGIED